MFKILYTIIFIAAHAVSVYAFAPHNYKWVKGGVADPLFMSLSVDPNENNQGTFAVNPSISQAWQQSQGGTNKVEQSGGTHVISKIAAPTVTKWRQNADYSITGKVSNCKDYPLGQLINTSPLEDMLTHPGSQVVTLASGSKINLQGKGTILASSVRDMKAVEEDKKNFRSKSLHKDEQPIVAIGILSIAAFIGFSVFLGQTEENTFDFAPSPIESSIIVEESAPSGTITSLSIQPETINEQFSPSNAMTSTSIESDVIPEQAAPSNIIPSSSPSTDGPIVTFESSQMEKDLEEKLELGNLEDQVQAEAVTKAENLAEAAIKAEPPVENPAEAQVETESKVVVEAESKAVSEVETMSN